MQIIHVLLLKTTLAVTTLATLVPAHVQNTPGVVGEVPKQAATVQRQVEVVCALKQPQAIVGVGDGTVQVTDTQGSPTFLGLWASCQVTNLQVTYTQVTDTQTTARGHCGQVQQSSVRQRLNRNVQRLKQHMCNNKHVKESPC